MKRNESRRLRKVAALLKFIPDLDNEPKVHDIEGSGNPFSVSDKALQIHKVLMERGIDPNDVHRDVVFDVITELFKIERPSIRKGRKKTKNADAPSRLAAPNTFEPEAKDRAVYRVFTTVKDEPFYQNLPGHDPVHVVTETGIIFVPKQIEEIAAKIPDVMKAKKSDILRTSYDHVEPSKDPILSNIAYIEETLKTSDELSAHLGERDCPVTDPSGRILGYRTSTGVDLYHFITKINDKKPAEYLPEDIIRITGDYLASKEKPTVKQSKPAPVVATAPTKMGDKLPHVITIYTLLLSCCQISDAHDTGAGNPQRKKLLSDLIREYEKVLPDWL